MLVTDGTSSKSTSFGLILTIRMSEYAGYGRFGRRLPSGEHDVHSVRRLLTHRRQDVAVAILRVNFGARVYQCAGPDELTGRAGSLVCKKLYN
jgi:hypothetical protein